MSKNISKTSSGRHGFKTNITYDDYLKDDDNIIEKLNQQFQAVNLDKN